LALFSLSGQEQSSIEKSLRSDGLYNVTARSESGAGIELLIGSELELGHLASVHDDIDTAFHLDFANDQRTYWFREQPDANQAIQFADEWGSVTAHDQATWNSHLDEESSPIGFDVSGYGGEGVEVDGKGVDANAGLGGVVWVGSSDDPVTGEHSLEGVVEVDFSEGRSAGLLSGLLAGNVVLTVTYTVGANQNPKQLSVEAIAGATGNVGLNGSGQHFFTGGMAMGGGALDTDLGLVVESTLNMDLTDTTNLQLGEQLALAFTDPKTLIRIAQQIADRSQLLIAVYRDDGTSSQVSGAFGLALTFGANFGNSTQNKVLQKAGYANNGGPIQEWTECEDGTTPPSPSNY